MTDQKLNEEDTNLITECVRQINKFVAKELDKRIRELIPLNYLQVIDELRSEFERVKAENKKLRLIAEAAKALAKEWERYPGQLTGFENNLVDALAALEKRDGA